jgi:hypothetical protein
MIEPNKPTAIFLAFGMGIPFFMMNWVNNPPKIFPKSAATKGNIA